jgi:hypothetical protein
MREADYSQLGIIHARLTRYSDLYPQPHIVKDEDVTACTPYHIHDQRDGLYIVQIDPEPRQITVLEGDLSRIHLVRGDQQSEGFPYFLMSPTLTIEPTATFILRATLGKELGPSPDELRVTSGRKDTERHRNWEPLINAIRRFRRSGS